MIPRRDHRAFATATAIILLAFLATVSVAVMTDLRAQARRTLSDQRDAQLRQLLHAGGKIASDLPRIWSTTGLQAQTLHPEIPSEIGGRIDLIVQAGPTADSADAHVRATLADGQSASQNLHFTRTDNRWTLTSVQSD